MEEVIIVSLVGLNLFIMREHLKLTQAYNRLKRIRESVEDGRLQRRGVARGSNDYSSIVRVNRLGFLDWPRRPRYQPEPDVRAFAYRIDLGGEQGREDARVVDSILRERRSPWARPASDRATNDPFGWNRRLEK